MRSRTYNNYLLITQLSNILSLGASNLTNTLRELEMRFTISTLLNSFDSKPKQRIYLNLFERIIIDF